MKENWEIHWKDYYSILQIHPLAEPEVAKAAYRKLADKYHPDHNPDKQEWANKKFKEIVEAFEIIDNPGKRRLYYVAYCQRVNPKPIISPPPSSASTKTNRNTSPPNTSYTPQPPLQHQPKQKATPNVNPKNELTLNEQLKLLLVIASHDNNIYNFRKREWVKSINEIKKLFDNFGGGVRVGRCPDCKEKYVLENSDASVRQCVNPDCNYVLTPEYTPRTKRTTTTANTQKYSRPDSKDGLGNLHGKGRYSNDTTTTKNDTRVILVIFIVIGLFAIVAPWYKYIVSFSVIWLVISILLSIIFIPINILWVLELVKQMKLHHLIRKSKTSK